MEECCNINIIIKTSYQELKDYLIKRTGDTVLTEDIIQDSFLRLINEYNKNTRLNNPRAWLFKVAKNLLADSYRRKRNPESLDFEKITISKLPKPDSSNNEADVIPYMIKLLPGKYGKILYLSDIEGLPLKNIAADSGLSLSATKMRVRRGRKMLLEMFKECCEIEYTKNGKFCSCTIRENCLPLLQYQNLIA
jgi:RNA polymerase sigma-70 factor (ECF subfamily)